MGGPVKRQPDWHECATPTTPSHIRAYMDACKEWLLKIAEVNPGFKVLMFGDVSCDDVYIKNVSQC